MTKYYFALLFNFFVGFLCWILCRSRCTSSNSHSE